MMKRTFRVSAIVISLLTAVSIMTACNSGKTESSSSKASSNASNPFVSSASEAESDTSKTSQASTSVSETSENDKQSSVVPETTESSTQTSKPETQESSKETSMFDISEAMEELNKYRSMAPIGDISLPSNLTSDQDIQQEISKFMESESQTSTVKPSESSAAVSETPSSEKRTLKEYIEKSGGADVLSKYASQYSGDQADVKFYLVDDNTLALEMVVKSVDLSTQTEEARTAMTQMLEQSFETYKTMIRAQLSSVQQENDLADFSVELVVKDNNGSMIFNTTI